MMIGLRLTDRLISVRFSPNCWRPRTTVCSRWRSRWCRSLARAGPGQRLV